MFKLFIQEIMELHDRGIWDKKMRGNESVGIDDCPFCKDEESLTLWRGKHLKIIHNKYPYNGLENHLLLVPYRHVEHSMDLNNDELIELKVADKFFYKFYNSKDYFSLIRQTNGGKSIKHLHYHYLPGALYSNKLEEIIKEENINN